VLNLGNLCLDQVQILNFRQTGLHLRAVLLFVALDPWSPNRWPPPSIQKTKLDAGSIGNLAHQTAQGVDFSD
jgi:hypothetical protein